MSAAKKFWASIWEVLEIVLISVVTVFVIRQFLAQPFLVSGASMEPNFSDGQYLIIDEITYRFREPERGEVVVFRYPKNRKVFFIKRIVGLPGERVVIRDGKVRVFHGQKGVVLDEAYIQDNEATIGAVDMTLDAGQYFLLGDNRSHSFDSRSWGSVSRKDIIGIARLRLFPLNHLGVIEKPSY